MDPTQRRTKAVEIVTSKEVTQQITEKVYKQLELAFEETMINWNSIVQTTAKRHVTNAVEGAVKRIQEKLLDMINDENQTTNVIVQRFVLNDNNQLKLV